MGSTEGDAAPPASGDDAAADWMKAASGARALAKLAWIVPTVFIGLYLGTDYKDSPNALLILGHAFALAVASGLMEINDRLRAGAARAGLARVRKQADLGIYSALTMAVVLLYAFYPMIRHLLDKGEKVNLGFMATPPPATELAYLTAGALALCAVSTTLCLGAARGIARHVGEQSFVKRANVLTAIAFMLAAIATAMHMAYDLKPSLFDYRGMFANVVAILGVVGAVLAMGPLRDLGDALERRA